MADTPQLNHRMTALDASFLYLERPNALLHVGAIFTFAQPLAHDRLIGYLDDHLPLIPRYLQRAIMVPLNLGHPTWELDPEFDVHDHVIRHHLRRGDDAALAQLCAKLFAEPLDRNRPLWEMHLIEGYGEGCALLSKTHHCMIDGASGVQSTNLLMDASPNPPLAVLRSQPRADGIPHPIFHAAAAVVDGVRKQVSRLGDLVGLLSQPARALDEVRATVDAFSTLGRTLADPPPGTIFNGELSERRTLGWARFSLNEVRSIKNRLGGTVNDVVLSIIAGGLRRYLLESGARVDRALKTMVPVSVRGQSETSRLGNRVSMMVAALPIYIEDPLDRLRKISAEMEQLKNSGQSAQMDRLVGLSDFLPPILQRPLSGLQTAVTPVNTVCTNVPGPRETRYVLGQPVQQMIPLVPLGSNIGMAFAILSYADQLTIGVTADALQVTDARDVAAVLKQAYDDLWRITGLESVVPGVPAESALKRRARMHEASKRHVSGESLVEERPSRKRLRRRRS